MTLPGECFSGNSGKGTFGQSWRSVGRRLRGSAEAVAEAVGFGSGTLPEVLGMEAVEAVDFCRRRGWWEAMVREPAWPVPREAGAGDR